MKTKNNCIKISLKYVSNFSPNFLLKPYLLRTKRTDGNISEGKKHQLLKITCKNFILFILLLKSVFRSNCIRFFIKPKQSSIYNILRAPYKNKISRHQLTLSRFFFTVSMLINLSDNIRANDITKVALITHELKQLYLFFESNICFQHSSKMTFDFFLNNYFFI